MNKPNKKEGKAFPSCRKSTNKCRRKDKGKKHHHFVTIMAKTDTGKDNRWWNSRWKFEESRYLYIVWVSLHKVLNLYSWRHLGGHQKVNITSGGRNLRHTLLIWRTEKDPASLQGFLLLWRTLEGQLWNLNKGCELDHGIASMFISWFWSLYSCGKEQPCF